MQWLSLVVAVLFLVSCGKKDSLSGIYFSTTVPSDQKKFIIDDLTFLQNQAVSSTAQLSQTLGLGQVTSATLLSRIQGQMRYIVGEKFDYTSSRYLTSESIAEDVFFPESLSAADSDDAGTVTVMTNIGGYLYLSGTRDNREVYTLKIDDQRVKINSPQVGIFQIGAGLFMPWIKSSPNESDAHRSIRNSVYFHEGTHNLGHGNNVAFQHSLCPSNHSFAGKYQCDNAINGPYTVGAVVLEGLTASCQKCTTKEREGIRSILADYRSRVLSNATFMDTQPEGL